MECGCEALFAENREYVLLAPCGIGPFGLTKSVWVSFWVQLLNQPTKRVPPPATKTPAHTHTHTIPVVFFGVGLTMSTSALNLKSWAFMHPESAWSNSLCVNGEMTHPTASAVSQNLNIMFSTAESASDRTRDGETRSSSREVRIRVPFFSVGYFSRGTLPTKKG